VTYAIAKRVNIVNNYPHLDWVAGVEELMNNPPEAPVLSELLFYDDY
jgi:hypothetical protein